MNATATMLRNYLYPEFIRDLKTKTPDQFVAWYGTHVLLDVTLGGRLQFNYRSVIDERTSKSDMKKTVESGLKFAMGKYGADIKQEFMTNEIITWSKKNTSWKTWVKYSGGESSGTRTNYDSESGYLVTSFDIDAWEKSVNKENAGIVGINWEKTYPIYELIADANRPQVGDDLQIIFRIPWGHNKIILDKCKGNSAKALFYIRKTIENNWSRDVLLNFLGTDLYERQGKAITNFTNTLPIEQSDLAQAITKDPYNFDFLTLRERYDEKELKDALIEKVNNFLMELGTGFAYMGREVRIEVGDTEKFIDMLFYNTQRHCYVVVEIKTGKFDSSYAGQLGTYVVAVNHQMKTEADNPTLGLLICKDMDKVEAQYALESTSQPLGISSYELSKLIPEEFRGSMPTIEEIEAELNE